jgi:7-keto-8-aminopelargonate synthetase-like enzyme
MYEVDRSIKSFRRSVRSVAKRGYDMSKLEQTIDLLASSSAHRKTVRKVIRFKNLDILKRKCYNVNSFTNILHIEEKI